MTWVISGLCAMLYWLLGDLWDKFTASLLSGPLLKCLLSSQTHLHGDSGKKLLVWKSKFLHKWLPMEIGFVPKPHNREEDQALITQLDLGLQRQQPHSVQSCTSWGKLHKLRDYSQGGIYIFLYQLISHVFLLLLQPPSTWFPLGMLIWT